MSKLNSAVTAAMMATMSMAPGGTTSARTYRNDTNGNGGSIAVAARRGPINTTAMLRGRKRAERRARQRARR